MLASFELFQVCTSVAFEKHFRFNSLTVVMYLLCDLFCLNGKEINVFLYRATCNPSHNLLKSGINSINTVQTEYVRSRESVVHVQAASRCDDRVAIIAARTLLFDIRCLMN